MLFLQSSIAGESPVLRPVREALGRLWGGFWEASGLQTAQHSNRNSKKDLLLTTHCLSIVIQVLKKASKKHEKSFISGHKVLIKNTRSRDAPGLARFCPALPGRASTGSWDPRYTPSRAHVSIRHQAARPPAGVSD